MIRNRFGAQTVWIGGLSPCIDQVLYDMTTFVVCNSPYQWRLVEQSSCQHQEVKTDGRLQEGRESKLYCFNFIPKESKNSLSRMLVFLTSLLSTGWHTKLLLLLLLLLLSFLFCSPKSARSQTLFLASVNCKYNYDYGLDCFHHHHHHHHHHHRHRYQLTSGIWVWSARWPGGALHQNRVPTLIYLRRHLLSVNK